MKSEKFLFMALVLLVSLLCVSAVSAADDAAISDIVADANDATVLEESINDAALADSQSDENVLKDDSEAPHYEPKFADLDYQIQNGVNEIELQSDVNHTDTESYSDGIEIKKDLIINGNNHTIDGNMAGRIFKVSSGAVVTFKDITFVNANAEGSSHGGAIWNEESTVKAINCNFINNRAQYGAAVSDVDCENCIFINNSAGSYGTMDHGTAINCTFIDNYAHNDAAGIKKGTAINCTFINCHLNDDNEKCHGAAMTESTATNCTFIGNNAKQDGGAIYNTDATNCIFTNNSAKYGGAVYQGTAINCTFTGNSAERNGGAIYGAHATDCIFNGNSAAENGGAIYNTDATNCIFTNNSAKNGGAMIYETATNCAFTGNNAEFGGAMYGTDATDCIFTNNNAVENGGAMYEGKATNCIFQLNTAAEDKDMHDVTYDIYRIIVPAFSATDLKTYYDYGDKFNFTISGNQVINDVNTTVSIYKDGVFVANYSALSGEGWTVDLPVGIYTAVLSVPGSDMAPLNRTITVAKNPTSITASAVTATYNVNKNLVITLTDGKGNKLSGVNVTVTLGTAKVYTTDKNGQIKINLAKLVPKTYTAKISFAGNANYVASTKSVKVVVKKATPKLTAKAKSFKVKVKTKKYTVTLKNNKGAVLKKVKLTLRINKKTFKATTNSKGVATFKITNLKKRGKFTATVKFAGSKYYKALSKKVKITVKK